MALNIEWTNDSDKLTWTRSNASWNPGAQGTMAHIPEEVLAAGEGETLMTMTIAGQTLLNMGDMYCQYLTTLPDGSHFWFATRAIQPVNVGPFGYDPYWQILTGTDANPPSLSITGGSGTLPESAWRTPVSNPGADYYLNSAQDKLPSGYQIKYDPTAGGSDLGVVITISDLDQPT